MKTTICAAIAAATFALTPMTASAVTHTIGNMTASVSVGNFAVQTTGLTQAQLEPFGANNFGGTWSAADDPTITPPPASASTYLSPFVGTASGSIFANDPVVGPPSGLPDKRYFSVGGSGSSGGSSSPNTLSGFGEKTSIRLLWGSIDEYNSLTFGFLGGAADVVFDGTTIATELLSAAGAGNSHPEYVAIIDFVVDSGSGFNSMTFRSDDSVFSAGAGSDIAAMEFATVVPVPFGALLIGTAFLAAGAVRRFGRPREA